MPLCEVGGAEETAELLGTACDQARSEGVPVDGWGRAPLHLTPKDNLRKAILASWPELAD